MLLEGYLINLGLISSLFSKLLLPRRLRASLAAIGSVRAVQVTTSRWSTTVSNTAICKSFARRTSSLLNLSSNLFLSYQLLKDVVGLTHDQMADVFEEWNRGELDSFLIEITRDILRYKDTDGSPLVEKIRDAAGQVI